MLCNEFRPMVRLILTETLLIFPKQYYCRGSQFFQSIAGLPLPGSRAPCLPLSPFMWVAFAVFLSSLSPLVSVLFLKFRVVMGKKS